MDLIRFGRGIRALRHRRRWRQQDLAAACGLSRTKVARIELGRSEEIPIRDLETIALKLGARADLRLSWNGEALDHLLDADHARLVDQSRRTLASGGLGGCRRGTFWIRGERGSVDILAWHTRAQIVLVVEVKTVVPDQQSMLATLDRKARLGLEIGRERGWNGRGVGRLLVMRTSRTARRRVAAHDETYAAAFTHRTRAARAWLAAPVAGTPFAGLLFVTDVHAADSRHRIPRR